MLRQSVSEQSRLNSLPVGCNQFALGVHLCTVFALRCAGNSRYSLCFPVLLSSERSESNSSEEVDVY
jgi:hypothetical protein